MIEEDIKHIKALANCADENAKDAIKMVEALAEAMGYKIKYNDKYSYEKIGV